MPYHVRITPTDLRRRQRDVVVVDKDAAWIEEKIAAPRRRGDPVFIDGQLIHWAFIEEIHITETDQTSDQLLPLVSAHRRRSGLATPMRDEWYVAKEGRDVTDQFLTGPPGTQSEANAIEEPQHLNPSRNTNERDGSPKGTGNHPLVRRTHRKRLDPLHAWGVVALGTAGLVAIPMIFTALHGTDPHFGWWWPSNWMIIPAVILLFGLVLAVVPIRRSDL